jgi:hypothetical protein
MRISIRKNSCKDGDLVVITSPHLHVTNEGHIKKLPQELQHAIGYYMSENLLEQQPAKIPYGSICMLIDSKHGLVMFNKSLIMVSKNIIKSIE